MNRLVSVELRRSEFIVTSYTQTPPGFWQMNGHYSRVPSDVGPPLLGQSVSDALDASNRLQLRDVDASADSFAPVLVALGLKTYGQYMKGTVSVSVEVGDDDVLRVTPMRNGGPREGFVEIVDSARVLNDHSAASVGAAVVNAMTMAK